MLSFFSNFAPLPPPDLSKCFANTQCVLFKDEVIICGGNDNKCFSYHTLKQEYKYICSYPWEVRLNGHCVLRWKHNESSPNEIQLLSFGGQSKEKEKYTFTMTYKSVWSEDHEEDSKSQNDPLLFNKWIPMHNFNIGRSMDDLEGARALIGGVNNNFLFVTHFPGNIQVFDLNTMERCINVTNATLPTQNIQHHCFVPWTVNDERVPNFFVLFCRNVGLLIKFDETNKSFKYEKLPIRLLSDNVAFDTYIYCHDFIFLFGRSCAKTDENLNKAWKYSMKDRRWDDGNSSWLTTLKNPCAVVGNGGTHIHIFGETEKSDRLKKHIGINMSQLFEKHELLRMLQKKTDEIKELRGEIKKLKLERPHVIPMELQKTAVEKGIDKTVQPPKEWGDVRKEMEGLQQNIHKLETQSMLDWGLIEWDELELWSCDGLAQHSKGQLLTKMGKTVAITKNLLTLENTIDVHVSKMEKNLNESSTNNESAQATFAEMCKQKKESKDEFEKALLKYIKSIEEWNSSLVRERRAAAEQQKNEQLMKSIVSLKEFNQSLAKTCSILNTDMDHLKIKNDEFLEKCWKDLRSQWRKWNPRQLGIFIGHTLEYSRCQIITLEGIAQKDKIGSESLLTMAKNDWKDVFRLKNYDEGCNVFNAFVTCTQFRIDDESSEAHTVPNEFLCPLSNAIMKDPVIARDGVTYDRDSIVSKAPEMSNPSLFENGELKLTSDPALRHRIGEFLKSKTKTTSRFPFH